MAVGWYLRFSLSYRDVEELLVERSLDTDHVTVWRWVQRYAPELERRLPNDSFRKRYARPIIPLHASSMSINVHPTRRRWSSKEGRATAPPLSAQAGAVFAPIEPWRLTDRNSLPSVMPDSSSHAFKLRTGQVSRLVQIASRMNKRNRRSWTAHLDHDGLI